MPGKTLDELEHFEWSEPPYNSYLVTTIHRLRKKPVDEFTVENLRMMIGQKIGLQHLLPVAIDLLEREPLAQGDYYAGDLLAAVTECDDWLLARPDWRRRVVTASKRAVAELSEADSDVRARFKSFLERMWAHSARPV
jgi:hypothetical protein